MNRNLESALSSVELVYGDIVAIASDMTKEIFDPINALNDEIASNINNLTIDEIRGYILRLSTRAFQLVELRDKSAIKSECAEMVRKEAYAIKYGEAEGTSAQKDSKATLDISENIIVQALYELIASLFKSKIDGIFRIVDSLKSILMSKMQEYKIEQSTII